MDHKYRNPVRQAALTTFAALMVLTAGCGDGLFHKAGGASGSALSRQLITGIRGDDVELLGYTGCEELERDNAEARCVGVSGTRVEVFVDGESIIFDFSNVTKGGKISDADFEGYILTAAEDSSLPPILEAIIDASSSSIDSDGLDVQFDNKTVAVNFQGLDYDDATFIKIDLVFDEAQESI